MRVVVLFLVAVLALAAPPPAAAEDGWVWPVEGAVLTPYSNDNAQPYAGGMHRGIDIAARVGAQVEAARAGTVTHAGLVGSSGLTVAVRTADGRHVTSYLHLSAIEVRKGEAVVAGARIGAVGTSGRRAVAEPHLHFGVRLTEPAGHYVDPLSLLPALGAPEAAPPPVVPAPVPVRSEPAPVPAAAPVRTPRGRHLRAPVAARLRPRGTLQPGPVAVVRPGRVITPVRRRDAGPAARPRLPAFGPAPRPAAAAGPRAAARPVAPPAARADRGRGIVAGGLAAIALVLFGGLAWRGLGRANASVNASVARAGGAIRDQLRIGGAVKRLLRT